MTKLEKLKTMMIDGSFHHSTVRQFCGTGLFVYAKQENGFNGFILSFPIWEDDPDFPEAMEAVRNTGYSVGSYGQG